MFFYPYVGVFLTVVHVLFFFYSRILLMKNSHSSNSGVFTFV